MSLPHKRFLNEIWTQVPADYYFKLNYFQKLWHERKWQVFKQLFNSIAKEPKTVLEIGCSGGHLTGKLAEHFPHAKITGIDVYKPAIEEARTRFPRLKFLVADAHKLPFKSRSFDLILTSETIEHVVDPGKMLTEIYRVLKNDGAALIEMDSGSWLFRCIWWLWTNFGKGKVWKNAHLHPFTEKELEQLILKSDFILKHKIFSHFGMAVSFLVTKKLDSEKK